jgi:hypothetical protein
VSFGVKLGLSAKDARTLAKYATPEDIQDFITSIPINTEKGGASCASVNQTLKSGRAHCIEGALVAATALWMAGYPPLLMDMQAKGDDDHVIAIFKVRGHWGAISKSNLVWLRWRDPVYRNLRELAMSYFHEYVNKNKKTLRAYSAPFDLRRIPADQWITSEDCWDLAWTLDQSRHYKLITPAQAKLLKPRDKMELKAGALQQFKKSKAKNKRPAKLQAF